ncbi:unnamed protein product [Caenorhabditis auriculariae]|uniref:Uncharacterized protein n=1 Tax=Caenorhabditis auriculariae TaxID=2777116 RepID=A0A8S1GRV2_9PELO|nr:unnamed protein product [Caenorhabditis auriculariae]
MRIQRDIGDQLVSCRNRVHTETNNVCPENPENGIELRGILYQFCQPRQPPMCEVGEIAAEVKSLQTSIHCICPEDMLYIKRSLPASKATQYICMEKPICQAEEICGTGDASGTK